MIDVNYSNKNVYRYSKSFGICPDSLIGTDDILTKVVHLIRIGKPTENGFMTEDEALDILDNEMKETKHSLQYIQLELLAELEDAGFFILRKSEEESLATLMEKSTVVKESVTLKMRADVLREANIDQNKLMEIIMQNYIKMGS